MLRIVLYQSTVTCIHKFRIYYSATYTKNAIPNQGIDKSVGGSGRRRQRVLVYNEIVEFVGQRREIVVDVRYCVHGVKRGGGRSVREEDRHNRQVLVAVELSFVLCENATQCSYSYT